MSQAPLTEPIITCPSCRSHVKLTESLAAPLVESLRRQHEEQLASTRAQVSAREREVAEREAQIARDRETIDGQVSQKLAAARAEVAADEARRARAAVAAEVAQSAQQLADLRQRVEAGDRKLAEASKAQADLLRKQRALDDERRELELTIEQRALAAAATARDAARLDAKRDFDRALAEQVGERDRQLAEANQTLAARSQKLEEAQRAQAEVLRRTRELEDARRELDLEIEKRVSASVADVRTAAKREAEQEIGLRVSEKELMISQLQTKVDELRYKLEQGSQQLQGEVLELRLEQMLGSRFPSDALLPVPKGEYGGDLRQQVFHNGTAACGTILWESKRTKNWVDAWLPKLRDDQRAAQADLAVLVSSALPKGVDTFECVDNVWVVHPRAVLPMAVALRQTLIEVSYARQTTAGQQTKMELVYQYLTSTSFRRRIEAIVEVFTTMEADLAREKKALTAQWAKRERQMSRIAEATSGLWGDLQGIAGQSLSQIDGLALESTPDDAASAPDPDARAIESAPRP